MVHSMTGRYLTLLPRAVSILRSCAVYSSFPASFAWYLVSEPRPTSMMVMASLVPSTGAANSIALSASAPRPCSPSSPWSSCERGVTNNENVRSMFGSLLRPLRHLAVNQNALRDASSEQLKMSCLAGLSHKAGREKNEQHAQASSSSEWGAWKGMCDAWPAARKTKIQEIDASRCKYHEVGLAATPTHGRRLQSMYCCTWLAERSSHIGKLVQCSQAGPRVKAAASRHLRNHRACTPVNDAYQTPQHLSSRLEHRGHRQVQHDTCGLWPRLCSTLPERADHWHSA